MVAAGICLRGTRVVAERLGQENPSLGKVLTCKARVGIPRRKPHKARVTVKMAPQMCQAAGPCQHSSCRGTRAGKSAEHSPASSLHSLSQGEGAEPRPAVQGCCQRTPKERWLPPHSPKPSPWRSQDPGSRAQHSWLMMLQGFGCPCKGFEVSAQKQNRNICRASV